MTAKETHSKMINFVFLSDFMPDDKRDVEILI